MPIIPALYWAGRREANVKANLVYIVSYSSAWASKRARFKFK